MNPDEHLPLILVTNDDGIHSPGLAAVVAELATIGTVLVAAPTHQQTARGRSMVGEAGDTFHPVEIAPSSGRVTAWHIAASPALVVRHALAALCTERFPDLVVSGINYGENLGNNIMISGTLGAAFQAAAQGIPTIAVSRATDIEHHFEYGDLDWTEAARITRKWAERLLAKTFRGPYLPESNFPRGDEVDEAPGSRLPFDVLKIDVPAECTPTTEERFTRLSKRHYFVSTVEKPSVDTPIGSAQTVIDGDPRGLSHDDDIYAVLFDHVVSLTPLQLDNTAPLDAACEALMETERTV